MDKKLTVLDCSHIEKEISERERSITQHVSTESVDRGNDIVVAKGINLKNFRKNPIVLFNHDRDLPIASSMWQKVDDVGLLTKTTFSKTPFADDIYTLHLEKILNAWSIGFMPMKWEFDEKREITTYTNVELYEYSSVTLPMNPEALDEAKGMVKSVEGLGIIKIASDTLKVETELAQFYTTMDELDNKVKELANIIRDDSLLASIEKLENDVARLEITITDLTFKILDKNIRTEKLDIDVKKIISEL